MMDVQVVIAILQVRSILIHFVLRFLPIINFLITQPYSKFQTLLYNPGALVYLLTLFTSADALPVKN